MPDTPPLVVVEVLSLDDRLTAVREKLEEYRAWGVPHVWLVDPHGKRLYICDRGLMEVSSLQILELGIELLPNHIFDRVTTQRFGPAIRSARWRREDGGRWSRFRGIPPLSTTDMT